MGIDDKLLIRLLILKKASLMKKASKYFDKDRNKFNHICNIVDVINVLINLINK